MPPPRFQLGGGVLYASLQGYRSGSNPCSGARLTLGSACIQGADVYHGGQSRNGIRLHSSPSVGHGDGSACLEERAGTVACADEQTDLTTKVGPQRSANSSNFLNLTFLNFVGTRMRA